MALELNVLKKREPFAKLSSAINIISAEITTSIVYCWETFLHSPLQQLYEELKSQIDGQSHCSKQILPPLQNILST